MEFILGNQGDVKIIPVLKEDKDVKDSKELFNFLKEREYFKAEAGELYADLSLNSTNTVFLGLGSREDLDLEVLRSSFFNLRKELEKYKIEKANLKIEKYDGLSYEETISAIAEGFLQAEYSYDKFLTDKKDEELYFKKLFLTLIDEDYDKLAENIFQEVTIVMEGVFFARDLVNEPAMYMTPSKLAEKAKEELEATGVDVEVFGREKIEALKMDAFLAVAQGSDEEPKFIVMTYMGDPSSDEKLALVGKGLTYDSGGYCIKSPQGMATMHCDMGGAGAVIGSMKAISKAKLKKNVVAIVAACENMISGHAYKTGDIISSMAGKTIEVGNTDAEGRLTLADALYYAATVVEADRIIDLATLTGACVAALSSIHTGVVTNDKAFYQEFSKASDISGELFWELPNHDLYRELIKSKRADLSNTGRGGAGTITAGQFLENFVEDKPWIHLDIAGTAYLSSSRSYLPEFATGTPVKTLYYLVKNI